MERRRIELIAEPLTAEGFAPFGNVIEADPESENHFSINGGLIERFNDLATIDVNDEGGRPLINIAICNKATQLPYSIAFLERHPLGSQAFIPMDDTPMIVAVAPAKDEIDPSEIRAFISNGKQGINYHKSIWHMPMTPLADGIKMLMIDRGGEGNNYEEFHFPDVDLVLNAEL
ncbi:ureidoglycolate lyase [Leucothrix sargassi]|nr:ureidoglycolate lyase [Leucothrix sargassi]